MHSQPAKQIPLEALRFAASVEFGTADSADPLAPVPITIRARSNQPTAHWYFGRVVHDMAGMIAPKPNLPFDYCHDCKEVIGAFDQHHADETAGLTVAGRLIPFTPTDRAAEIKYKGAAGVPYEGSINFSGDGILIEDVLENQIATVNGYAFQGPGAIIRRWPLRGVALCPYGQDAQTEVLFKAHGPGDRVAVQFFTQENPAMSATQTPAPPAANAAPPAETPTTAAAAAAPPAAEATAEETLEEETDTATPANPPAAAAALSAGQQFVTLFGQQGALWYVEGKTLDEARTLFSQQQADKLSAALAENADLKTKLSAFRGERDPLSFSPEATPEQLQAQQFAQRLGDTGIARFAASIKLPGKK